MDDNNTPQLPGSGGVVGNSAIARKDGDKRTDTTFKALSRISETVKFVCNAIEQGGVRIQLPISQIGTMQDLKPQHAEFEEVFDDSHFRVNLKFTLQGKAPQIFEFLPEAPLGEINRTLRQDHIQVLGSRRLPSEMPESSLLRLELASRVPVKASFQSNPNFAEIIFHFSNLGGVGEQAWYLDPEMVDEHMLQCLEDFLLGRNNEFFELPGIHRDPQEETTPLIELGENADILAEAYKAEVVCLQSSRRALEKRLELSYWGDTVIADSSCREFRIGRRPPVELKIASRFVSRLHATIIVERNTFTLRDHSSNGTFIQPDGKPVFSLRYSSHVLRGSGLIALGEEVDEGNPHLIRYRII